MTVTLTDEVVVGEKSEGEYEVYVGEVGECLSEKRRAVACTFDKY